MKKYFVLMGLLLATTILAEPLDKVIAIVNDNVITKSELENHLSLAKEQQLAQDGKAIPDNLLKKQVLQNLIDESLQMQLAKQNNLSVEESDVNNAIEKIASMNHLSLNELKEAIANQGMNWTDYRKNIKKEVLLVRLQQKLVGREVVVTPEQVDDFIKSSPDIIKNDYVYTLENIVIPLPEEPTPEQLKAARTKAFSLLEKARKGGFFQKIRIEESNNDFMLEGGELGERHLAELPDLFAKEVVKMKVGQVQGPLRAGNGLQLIKLVKLSGANLHHEVTKYHVRHILFKVQAGMVQEEVKKQAFNVYQQIKAGKNFAIMAKRYSVDVASSVKGGDLGWVGQGEVVPEFEKAMTTLPLHVVSKPVKSGFGWHIIEVLDKKTQDDSEAFKRQQVMQFLQQKKFAEAIQNWKQNLRNSSYVKIVEKELA